MWGRAHKYRKVGTWTQGMEALEKVTNRYLSRARWFLSYHLSCYAVHLDLASVGRAAGQPSTPLTDAHTLKN